MLSVYTTEALRAIAGGVGVRIARSFHAILEDSRRPKADASSADDIIARIKSKANQIASEVS